MVPLEDRRISNPNICGVSHGKGVFQLRCRRNIRLREGDLLDLGCFGGYPRSKKAYRTDVIFWANCDFEVFVDWPAALRL